MKVRRISVRALPVDVRIILRCGIFGVIFWVDFDMFSRLSTWPRAS